jgi:hypothetical protein
MERFAVCVDEVDEAARALAPLFSTGGGPAHCVLVACPPGLGRRIGRWLTPAMRRQWADHWAASLGDRLAPVLAQATGAAPGLRFEWVVAGRPLPVFIRDLRLQHGAGLRLVDARRQHPGRLNEPMTLGPPATGARLAAPVAVVSSLSLLLALAD